VESGVATERTKRALVLAGAGASLEFGAPSTDNLTRAIETGVLADGWMQHTGADCAYLEISKTLADYFQGGASAVNFEHVYHCAHELLFTFEPTAGAVNEYRPILVPFIERKFTTEQSALQALVDRIPELIFAKTSEACNTPAASLVPIAAFLGKLRADYITRIYTTNYDDFLLQAIPDLYTGFDAAPSANPKSFDGVAFWRETDSDAVFHLHGSVHLAFGPPLPTDVDLGTLHWFDNRDAALRNSSFRGSGERRMDGSQFMRTAAITGLDKLSRIQQQPLSHYYASLARDAMTADIIYVIGSGLGDLHLNTWLGEARRKNPKPPLVFVGWWPNSFLEDTASKVEPLTMEMLHSLRMLVNQYYGGVRYGSGWTLAKDRTCAIWDKGFLVFLGAAGELNHVLARLV